MNAGASLAVRRTQDPAGVSGPINLEQPKYIAVKRLCEARDALAEALASVVARLTASEVHPTPPAAAVIVINCGPRLASSGFSTRLVIRRLTDSSSSSGPAGRVRNSRAPARMTLRITAVS